VSDERTLRFAIIGAGMAGILCAIKLREAGYDDFVLYEKADRLGGTWRENTYPGIACDVPSHAYSYSFEPNPEWSSRFSPGGEIQAYFEGVARKHGVDARIRFGEEVTRCERGPGGRWQLTTRSGLRHEADVVLAATGVLHHPKLPEIPGLETFGGACFHSARWDHGVAIDGRRVGVIGTGSTAVQITSAVVPRVAQYRLFQRTAPWIMPQENPAYTDAEREAFRRDPALLHKLYDDLSQAIAGLSAGLIDANSPQMQFIEATCRANLERNVRDPELRERLRPSYRAACKRLILSPDFYDAIQQPHAELVTDGIERVEREGVRTRDGRLHPLDVLVLATGFRVDRFIRPTEVIGRNGRRLDDVWSKRPIAYLSVGVPGFPNLFLLNGPNGPVGNFSLIQVAELQIDYILQLVARLREGRCREISPTAPATEAFDTARTEAAKHSIWSTGCRSWYLDDRGVPATWPWTFDRFREEMAAPKLEAYEQVG
jgi:cation diffusion facilitator CzcD-associated flavoprotein CzcO